MTAPLTPEQLADLRRLLEAATAGEWEAVIDDDVAPWVRAHIGGAAVAVCEAAMRDASSDADAALIVAMRNALPALLDAARERDEARAEVERLRGLLAKVTRFDVGEIDGDHFNLEMDWWKQKPYWCFQDSDRFRPEVLEGEWDTAVEALAALDRWRAEQEGK